MYNLDEVISALQQFSKKGKFLFHQNSILSEVCNVPPINNYSGIYLFYNNSNNELLYIGISGRETSEGEIKHRKDGLRGRLVNGKQFGDFRRKTLPEQMKKENIMTIRIEWFVTYGFQEKEIPRKIEIVLLHLFMSENGRLPGWNKEI